MATDVVFLQRRSIVTTTISAVIAAFAIGYVADGSFAGILRHYFLDSIHSSP